MFLTFYGNTVNMTGGSAQYTVSLYRQIYAMGAWIKTHTENEMLFAELDLLHVYDYIRTV
jgi:hypothetical protein